LEISLKNAECSRIFIFSRIQNVAFNLNLKTQKIM